MQEVVDTVPLFPSLGWGKQSFSLTLYAPFKAMGASVQNLSHASSPKPFFLVDQHYAECPTASANATSGRNPSISSLQLLINMWTLITFPIFMTKYVSPLHLPLP